MTIRKSDSPRIFIGSSREGLSIAEAIQLGLDHEAAVTTWHQGVFGLSRGTLEELVRASRTLDFAVLVLTPDDLTVRRATSGNAARDNVIFELGLFMGVLGRDRTFIVHPRDTTIDLPSDVAGVVPLTFRTRADGNLRAGLGPACTEMKEAVRRLAIGRSEGPRHHILPVGEERRLSYSDYALGRDTISGRWADASRKGGARVARATSQARRSLGGTFRPNPRPVLGRR